MNEIIDRKMAIAMGLKRYFTGKPCCNGHVEERYVGAGTCCVCAKANARRHCENHPKGVNIKEYQRKWYAANRERLMEKARYRDQKISVMLQTFKQLGIIIPEINT